MATTNNQTPDATQTTFLGATIIDFNSNLAFRSQGSSLQVNIVEDKSNTRTTRDSSYGNYNFQIDSQGKTVAGVNNDPSIPSSYPNGDEFYFPALGNAVFFKFGDYKFNGILKTAERNISPNGGVTYTVSVEDPTTILDASRVILGDFLGMAEPNYGWLTATYNYSHRGPDAFEGGALNNPTYNFGSSPFLSLGMWNPGGYNQLFYNVINPYGFLEQKFGLGTTRTNWDGTIASLDQAGMNWLTALETIADLINYGTFDPSSQFGSPIKFAGSRFRIDMGDLWDLYLDGIIPVNYRFTTNNASLLELVSDICEIGSSDFYLTLDRLGREQDYDPNSATNEWLNRLGPIMQNNVGDVGDVDPTDNVPIAGVIRVNVVRRTTPPTSLTVIQDMIEGLVGAGDVSQGRANLQNPDQPQETAGTPFVTDDTDVEDKVLVSATHGRELTDEAVGKVVIGGKQSRIAFGFTPYQVWSLVGTAQGQVFYGVAASSIDDSSFTTVQVPGLGHYQVTVREMRHALVSKDSWEAFVCGLRAGVPNTFNPGGMNIASMFNIGSSFSRMTPALLTKLINGNITPFMFNALSNRERQLSQSVHTSTVNENSDLIYNAVKTVASEFYGKQLAVPLPLMVKGFGEVGQRVNEWEITSGGWVEPGAINGQWDNNLVDDKGRVKPLLTYGTNADFSDFSEDDFVYPTANTATLVNLSVNNKVYDAGIHNFALVKVGSCPKKFDLNYNGLWESMDLAYGTQLEYQAWAKGVGSDNAKYSIAPSAHYPFEYGIPQESRYHMYGPWAAQSGAVGTGYGKVDLEVDNELKPENFGSTPILDTVALSRVFATAINSSQSERGSITLSGTPQTGTSPQIDSVNLGTQLIDGGPYLTGVSCNISADQAQTTYQMATWKVSFGKLTRFNQSKIQEVVTNRNKAAKLFRQLFKIPPPNSFYSNLKRTMSVPKRFAGQTTHPYIGMHAYKYGDFVFPYVGSMGNDEIRVYTESSNIDLAFVDWSAVVRGFGANGPIGNLPGHHDGAGFAIGGDDMWPTAQFLNHWNYDGDEGDHDTGVINSSKADPTIERDGFGTSQVPMGLRGPLYLVGWGFDLCADPVPGAGRQFVPNHRRKSDSWKAGPVDLRWNSKTETWQPPPQILEGTSTQDSCGGNFDAELSDCNSRKVTVKNPLSIPVRNNANVLIWSDQEENEYVLIQSEYYQEDDYVVCDVSCCDDGTLAVSLKDFFIQWPADPECFECPEADC